MVWDILQRNFLQILGQKKRSINLPLLLTFLCNTLSFYAFISRLFKWGCGDVHLKLGFLKRISSLFSFSICVFPAHFKFKRGLMVLCVWEEHPLHPNLLFPYFSSSEYHLTEVFNDAMTLELYWKKIKINSIQKTKYSSMYTCIHTYIHILFKI